MSSTRWRPSQQVAVAVVFVTAMFMSILDTTIVIVALPTMARDFKVGTDGIEWVVVGYLLSLATWIPASGWIGDRVGTKKTLLTAVVVFTAASGLCATANSLTALVAFRVLQGVGGGLLTPVGTAMLFRAFPPEQRARASRILIIPTATAPALGPVLGGLMVEKLSWRWAFLINLPVGVVALAWGWLYLEEHREPRAGSFDLPGFLLGGAGLPLVLYAASEGPSQGWGSAPVVVTALLGIACVAAFVRVELRREFPMLRLRLLSDRMFRRANFTSAFAYGGFLGLLFLLPLYLQQARGLSPIQSGLTTCPEAIGVLAFSQVSGRLYPVVGPRRLMMAGLSVITVAMLVFTQLQLDTSLWAIRGVMFVAGMGLSCVLIPLQAATYATISPADTGHASAIFVTQRQVAAAIGVAVLATVLSAQLGAGERVGPGSVSAFKWVFAVDAAIALIGLLMASTVRDADAAATMRARMPAAAMAE